MIELTTETTINTTLVTNWNSSRYEKLKVINLFEKVGNNFSFTLPNNETDDIHIYLGLNKGEINLYLIKSSCDTIENRVCANAVILSNSKVPLHACPTIGTNADTIFWQVANERINNWMNDTSRNSWINNQFENLNPKDAIFQVFIVKSMDIVPGDIHKAYLALKGDNVSGYSADLIIVNSNNQIISKNIEDMVHSVPPFGNLYSDFGLLNYLDIL